MKANLFAAVLSLSIVSFPLQATTQIVSPPAAQQEQPLGKINLNKADAQSLSNSVKGIGPKRAEAIVQYREKHGAFKSIEDLAEVRGLGKQFVKNNLKQLQATFSLD